MTIREALIEANKSIDTFDASILLANILTQRHSSTAEITRSKLCAISEEQIDEELVNDFRSLVERRRNGECVAYITGKKEFWGLEFFVNSSVLVPRPETELLVERALNILTTNRTNQPDGSNSVLDLCTGSGAIAIALKHEMPELEVFAADISAEAIEVAKKNAQRLLSCNNITFLQSDLYGIFSCPLSANLWFDVPCPLFSLIVSNAPYIPSDEIKKLQIEVRNEPRLALDGGETGLEIIKRIIKDTPDYLRRGGSLLLEADPRQMEEIKTMLSNSGFNDINIYKDLAGFDRVIGGRYSC